MRGRPRLHCRPLRTPSVSADCRPFSDEEGGRREHEKLKQSWPWDSTGYEQRIAIVPSPQADLGERKKWRPVAVGVRSCIRYVRGKGNGQ